MSTRTPCERLPGGSLDRDVDRLVLFLAAYRQRTLALTESHRSGFPDPLVDRVEHVGEVRPTRA